MRVFRLIALIIFLLLIAPYGLNYLILPSKHDPTAAYFDGEWYNRLKISEADAPWKTLDRWAHYYGKHGCEPPCVDCPYAGILGQYRLLFDYIKETEPCPIQYLEANQ